MPAPAFLFMRRNLVDAVIKLADSESWSLVGLHEYQNETVLAFECTPGHSYRDMDHPNLKMGRFEITIQTVSTIVED
jgi:hypothetical protein